MIGWNLTRKITRNLQAKWFSNSQIVAAARFDMNTNKGMLSQTNRTGKGLRKQLEKPNCSRYLQQLSQEHAGESQQRLPE